jgi:hypothetical protein
MIVRSAEKLVEDYVEAKPPQSRVDLLGEHGPWFKPELLSQCYAHGGGNLHHAGLGVRPFLHQGFPDLFRLVLLVDGAHGAMRRALAALDARAFRQRHVRSRSYARLLAAP